MKTLDISSEIRSDNLRKEILNKYESIYMFCTKTGEDYSSITKYLNKALKIGDKVAKRLEQVLEVKEGSLDSGIVKEKFISLPILSTYAQEPIIDFNYILEQSMSTVPLQLNTIEVMGFSC